MVLTKLERKLICEAFELVKDINSHQKSRHVSFLVRRNKIITYGVNKTRKSHPFGADRGYRKDSIHSELDLLIRYRGYPRDFKRLILYNIKFTRSNLIGLAKPCLRCQSLLDYYNIKCFYTNSDGVFEC